MFTLIIFIASGLGIVALLGHKYFELTTGKKTFISQASTFADEHVTTSTKVFKMINAQNATKIVAWFIAYGILLLRKLFIYIQNRSYSKKIVDVVSGKGTDKNTSGASVFLKRIKDHDRVDSL
ncbi:MAG: hypothetical protein KBD47_02550 [Candidatus Pacebacteria bacterium]|jgi:hypothetical protein|nr:hypothetical protein [Candidatus Paceibacterota bacterium]